MWEELKQLPKMFITAVSLDGQSAPRVQVEPKLQRLRPPLIMRLQGIEEEPPQDNFKQFMDYGWRFGEVSQTLAAVERMVAQSVVAEYSNVVEGLTVKVGEEFWVRIQSTIEHGNVDYVGRRHAVMYFPPDLMLLGEDFATSSVFGGATDAAMTILRKVALALNMKIQIVEEDSIGGLIAFFHTNDPTLQLADLRKTWTK